MQQALQKSQGLGTLILDLLISKVNTKDQAEERKQLRQELIGTILRSDVQSEDVAEYGPEISSVRHQELTKRIVARLHFPSMEDREEQIAQAHAITFRWIFDEDSQQQQKWSNFKQWLESDAQLYWIMGKAGSGKSTLMKYICQPTEPTSISSPSANLQPRCIRDLEEWAAGSKLRIGNFFFWNSGASLQMTQAGLVRSLLDQILVWAPELVSRISPKRWEVLCLFNEDSSDRWSDHELEQMMRLAMIHLPNDTKLCLFIDGLDEFDGNHDVLIRLLKNTLATNHNVKLCVSTRPWDIFADAFHHNASLRLQDLTYEDMKSYTSSELHADPRFALLQERESEYAQDLVENIVSKASGVFLWVRLVLSSLLAGIEHGDRITDLQKRLDLLPPELEQLYDKMLDSVDAFYLEHSAQLLNMIEESVEPPSVLLMSFADEESFELSLKRPIAPMLQKEAALRVDTMRRRLNACTKGLLEIPGATVYLEEELDINQTNDWTVHYLHRTVKDYLKSQEVRNRLVSLMKTPFDCHLRLCVGHLAHLKAVGPKLFSEVSGFWFWERVKYCLYHAARISSKYNTKTIALMDDLDKAATSIIRNLPRELDYLYGTDRWFVETGQWVGLWPGYRRITFGGHFLSLNVRYGVIPYVETRAKPRCLIQKAYVSPGLDLRDGLQPDSFQFVKAQVYPLLLDAISYDLDPLFIDLDLDSDSVPNPDMVACLLRKGASFDWACQSNQSNHWRFLLRAIVSCWDDEENLMKWMKIAKLALQNGSFIPSESSVKRLLQGGVLPTPDKLRALIFKLEDMRGK